MIRIYGGSGTRSIKVAWMAEEMGLDYEMVPVDVFAKERPADFLALSPTGMVPAMTDGEVVMLESCAMLEYLGGRYGPTPLAPPPGAANYPAYLQFLHYGEASFGAVLAVTMGSRYFAPEEHRDNWGGKAAVDMAVRRSVLPAAALKKSPFVAGDEFTAADISVSYALDLAQFLGFRDRLDPVLKDYHKRLKQRPAQIRARERSVIERQGPGEGPAHD
jgi:glutathione S-transferase